MPVDYKKGKIYKIECQETNRVYVGSTCQPTVAARLKGHVKCNKQYKQGSGGCVSSYSILDTGNYRCTLICNFPCESKDELTAHEATWIRKYRNDCDFVCVNVGIPGRTNKEWREDNKEAIKEKEKHYYEAHKESIKQRVGQYHKDNKETIKQKSKQYRKANKEALKQKSKQYREDNKEATKQQQKEYREANKEALKQKREDNKEANTQKKSVKQDCPCGSTYSQSDKSRHEKTKKHQAYLSTVGK